MIQAVEDFDTFARFWRRFSRWAEYEEVELALILKVIAQRASLDEMQTFKAALIYFQTHMLNDEERTEFMSTFKASEQGSDVVDMNEEPD